MSYTDGGIRFSDIALVLFVLLVIILLANRRIY